MSVYLFPQAMMNAEMAPRESLKRLRSEEGGTRMCGDWFGPGIQDRPYARAVAIEPRRKLRPWAKGMGDAFRPSGVSHQCRSFTRGSSLLSVVSFGPVPLARHPESATKTATALPIYIQQARVGRPGGRSPVV